MYNNKTISDVLEYLYQNEQKALAEVVLDELKQQREIVRETVVLAKTIKPVNPTPYTITYGGNTQEIK
jgi:hypothetical protein